MSVPTPHAFIRDADDGCQVCPLPEEHPTHVPVLPETPYAGTSGWSGAQTSRERAEADDASGATTERQERILAMLARAGRRGMTWREVADATGWHHGQASGALSVLHKAGHITHLSGREERRERCAPYVLPEHVDERETREQGRAVTDPNVVQYTEWRTRGDGKTEIFASVDGWTEESVRDCRKPGHELHVRTIVETPWETL